MSSPIAQSDDKAHALVSQVERTKEKAHASVAQTLRGKMYLHKPLDRLLLLAFGSTNINHTIKHTITTNS